MGNLSDTSDAGAGGSGPDRGLTVIIPRGQIAARVEELAGELTACYGLDYDDLYRGLPDLCVLDPHGTREGAQ